MKWKKMVTETRGLAKESSEVHFGCGGLFRWCCELDCVPRKKKDVENPNLQCCRIWPHLEMGKCS